MGLHDLLWGPLPDPLPAAVNGRRGWLARLFATMTAQPGEPRLPPGELVDRRVRRGAVQALVREAYQRTVAEQDSTRRKPDAFAQAWRAHLAGFLDQATVNLHGWSVIAIADLDVGLAWELFEAASLARRQAVEHAAATRSRRADRHDQVPAFEFSIVGDGQTLGDVTYGICRPCGVGLLYKIGFPTDWQYCGLGTLALRQLEDRHRGLTWYTTDQPKHARGFYDRYRQDSGSPWAPNQHPCHHSTNRPHYISAG